MVLSFFIFRIEIRNERKKKIVKIKRKKTQTEKRKRNTECDFFWLIQCNCINYHLPDAN